MQPATVRFMDQRVVFDRVTRGSFVVRIAGQFVGYGVDPHEVPMMQQWLGQAAFHALDRFVQPLSELPKQTQFWSAEVTALINPVFNQHFRAQGTVQIASVEVLPAATGPSIPAPNAPAQPAPRMPHIQSTLPVASAPPPTAPQVAAQPRVAPVVLAPPEPVEEPIAEGPVSEHEPWELELRAITDPPTSVQIKPAAVIVYTGAAIAAPRMDAAKTLAAECVAAEIEHECARGRSVLDLLLFASMLSSGVNERFASEVGARVRVKGTIALRDLRLSQEDAERLRDLYGQIAAARGG